MTGKIVGYCVVQCSKIYFARTLLNRKVLWTEIVESFFLCSFSETLNMTWQNAFDICSTNVVHIFGVPAL